MKFKVGDKVKFLNEKGGGIVSKILSGNMVNVTIDDGFDLPVMASDLILMESQTTSQRFFDEQYDIKVNCTAEAEPPAPARKPFALPEAIYMALLPDDQNVLIIGDVEVFLVNNTAYDIIYSIYLKDKNKHLGIDFGNIEPYSTASLQTTDREQLEYFGQGTLQLMFFKESLHDIIPPMQKEFRIKLTKLLKEDNYAENPVFRGKAYIQKVADLPELAVEKNSEALPEAQKIPESQLLRESVIKKHRIDDEFAEVDLHIEALCENPNRLANHEKLQIQLDYFTRCIESAILENYKRIVFIHGVGAGILKLELTNILQQYEFIEYFDPSIARYGIGATEVLIHQKKE